MVLTGASKSLFGLSSLISVWILASEYLDRIEIDLIDFIIIQILLFLLGLTVMGIAIWYHTPNITGFDQILRQLGVVVAISPIAGVVIGLTGNLFLIILLVLANIILIIRLPAKNKVQQQIKIFGFIIISFPIIVIVTIFIGGFDLMYGTNHGILAIAIMSLVFAMENILCIIGIGTIQKYHRQVIKSL